MPGSVQYRPETLIIKIASLVPAADDAVVVPWDKQTGDIMPLKAGIYKMGIVVTSNVNGTSTVLDIVPFTNPAQTVTGDSLHYYDETGTLQTDVTLPAGSNGLIWGVLSTNGSWNVAPDFAELRLPFGLQVGITKGGATTGELLKIYLVCQRVS